jgi:tRNA dimethylallyltransferase
VNGPVLALLGPTAAGKSELALSVAERLGNAVEIVAVDSFTVYRDMDIGTAKPSAEARARVPHHLVDVLDPEQDCTVAWFQQAARTAIDDVRGRRRVPLLVGGSGLYWRAVVDPLEFPPTDADLRTALEARYAGTPQAAHAALAAVDPAAAARIDPANLRRAVRALEVLELTGRPFSKWYTKWEVYQSIYEPLHAVGLGVVRSDIVARIDARVEAMVAAGWLQECRRLAARPLSTTARQAIGYAELLDHLAGHCPLDEAIERTKVRTRRYATRQQRWFAADPRIRWLSAGEAASALTDAVP